MGTRMTQMPVLVTGGTGFVGAHLLAALERAFPERSIHATARTRPRPDDNAGCVWHELDICDHAAVDNLIRQVAPGVVVHLAAQSNVPFSFEQPDLTWDINLGGARNLFQALDRLVQPVLLLQIGSADMYGGSFHSPDPVDESTPLLPLNPYAASKAAADLAAYQLSCTSSVKVIRARPFNHIGAGQADGFVVSSFARQIVEIEMGGKQTLQVGDLTAERDFLHVSDVVDAYIALIKQQSAIDNGAAVNICSGGSVRISDMLDELVGLSVAEINVQQDPGRMRKSDIARVCGSYSYLSDRTGWRPATSLRDALRDVLDDWRRKLYR
ncbi:GDP-mannose 4,6-dehydratase [Marinobacterium weihaiense]|uniref:GDP-mannose 4,6-dehydratase n=1 Tax=Marinobacterium weihaiense TaxID=2851016 RepID=A0ABS6M7Q3_9GAMM|nr:GDP-mannose 4,6-dehydratase [Marinobacterium weihaiense]MBV0932308.1 GDP-mannose 4,6-dehydratase [Marinobacterium weihaiense]